MGDKSILGSKHYYKGRNVKRKPNRPSTPETAVRRPIDIEKYIRDLRDLRGRAGLTQKVLAELLKTRQSAISRFENGHGVPSVSFLQRYARAVGGKISISVVV
ncbi:MAG: helix-turn-helix transcriptional regulator [Patescibacteria group bacterium]